MLIKDMHGKYQLKVDKERRIVHETAYGSWDEQDYERMFSEYKEKVIPYLGKVTWAKMCHMKEYKPSTKVTPELINNCAKWLAENGFRSCAIILDSATLKMQLNRSAKDAVGVGYFDNEKEADEWLRGQGF